MDPCSDAQERVAGLLFDGLADDEHQALDEHLAGCAACRTELDELTALAVMVQDHGTHRPKVEPLAEADPVVARTRPAGRRARPLVLAGALAVVGLIAVVALVLRSASPDPVEAALVGEADGTVTLHELDSGVGIEVRLAGLDDLERGTYETWMVGADGSTVSAGSFEASDGGRASVALHTTGDVDHYRVLLVTAEPDRRDPARNGPTVAEASLPDPGR
ncbi:MAG TPA: anti-sigma factor [Acidimicrobiales bacterium]|nr:anti-sigma factor [Acidimicrobiales bacterium]